MEDFIKHYTETVSKFLDAPLVFIEASAYWIVSSLLGRFFKCLLLPPLSARPNLWFALSSIPGALRRSTVQEYAKRVYRKAYIQYLKEYKNMDEAKARETVINSLIEEGTPEGIIDHIESSNLETYAIVSSEFGSVLKRSRERDYEAGVLSLLSKMYYGEGGLMHLSQRGGRPGKRELREGLYVTMLAGMQEPKHYITPDMIRQGLMRRIIICFVDSGEHERWIPPIDLDRRMAEDKLDELAQEIKNMMVEYSKICEENLKMFQSPLIDVFLLPPVKEEINDYERKLDLTVRVNPNDVNIYKQSLWEHLTKLAIVHAISRGELTKLAEGEVMNVRLEDLREAKRFLEETVKHIDEVISSLGEREEPIKTVKTLADRVYNIIASGGEKGTSGGEKGMKRSEAYRRLGGNISRRDFDEAIEVLLETERIREEKQSTGGRKAVIYYVVR
jgi:DNA-binding Xre family transcriptional regulator